MTPLLEAIQLHGFPQQRIGNAFGVGAHIQSGLVLGLHRDVPDRQACDALLRLRVELRPVDDGRLVGIERVEQRTAEQNLVRLAAIADRARRRDGRVKGEIG